MRRRLVLLAVAPPLAARGGHSSSQPAVQPALSTVGTVSPDLAAQPVIREVNAIRTAVNSGRADEAITDLYALINRAIADNDLQHGAAMIRVALPGLVAMFERSYPGVRARVSGVSVQTKAGLLMRRFALDLLARDHAELPAFEADVARSRLTFRAVERWGVRNNADVQWGRARLNRIFSVMAPDQRAAVMQAVRQVFGIPSSMSRPDRTELENAITLYLGTKLPSGVTLHVEVKPFKSVTWPPDSNRHTTELYLSVPFPGNHEALRRAAASLREAFERDEVLAGRFCSVEFSEESAFNEDHAELGRLRVLPVHLTVELA